MNRIERGSHRKARTQCLQPKMVFLVDEQSHVAAQEHRRTRAEWMMLIQSREFLADKMPFVQQLTVPLRQVVESQQQTPIQ